MNSWQQKIGRGCTIAIVVVALEGCAVTRSPAVTSLAATFTPTAVPSINASPTPSPELTPAVRPQNTNLPVPTVEVSMTPVAQHVVVTAIKGNVFIRRGPDFAFDSIGVLMKGQSATALARDVLAEWLEILLPGASNTKGWISIQSQFTSVTGDVMTLPELQPDYWPVGATVRNCTYHEMQLTPGGIVIPSVLSFPYNDVRVNPGVYTVIDTTLDTYPSVEKIEVKEGSAIDIHVDGLGNKRTCPIP